MRTSYLAIKRALWLFLFTVISTNIVQSNQQPPLLIHALRVFDGDAIRTNISVLVSDGKVTRIDKRDAFNLSNVKEIDLGDATLLPGFIDLHAHIKFHHISEYVVLKHGITTVRDVGGPLNSTTVGEGHLRVLSSGPIITAPDGYPINIMGADNIAIAVSSEQQARAVVKDFITGGASIIKIALEPGGEIGAPWTHAHQHHHEKPPLKSVHSHNSWPMLSEALVKAIVDEAHHLDHKVTAHIGESKGAKIALTAGVDEWAHVPCAKLSDALLNEAVSKNVTVVTTLDTLSKCPGANHNAYVLSKLGAHLLYGAEIAHSDIPWGIDAQELISIQQATQMEAVDILKLATSKSGEYLKLPLLGSLHAGAPADIIAVKGNPLDNFKVLEYPDFVMTGGYVVINNYSSGINDN